MNDRALSAGSEVEPTATTPGELADMGSHGGESDRRESRGFRRLTAANRPAPSVDDRRRTTGQGSTSLFRR
jgi:hypothetical protein